MMFLLLWIVCGFACGAIASSKGRSAVGWFLLGCLFSVFTLIVIACLPADADRVTKRQVEDGREKICPDCAEPVKLAAQVCRFCGHHFEYIETIPEPTGWQKLWWDPNGNRR